MCRRVYVCVRNVHSVHTKLTFELGLESKALIYVVSFTALTQCSIARDLFVTPLAI